MRLIDADKLMEDIIKTCKCQPYLEGMQKETVYVKEVIDSQPTVIDTCKVIGYLEKLKNRAEKQESIERYIAYDRAIDIVRGRWD